MRAIEFEIDLKNRDVLEIPPEVGAELPIPTHARVILIVDDGETDQDWRLFTYQQFLRSYSDDDAIYDDYDKHGAGWPLPREYPLHVWPVENLTQQL